MSITNAIRRWLRGEPPPHISRSEAIELAKAECLRSDTPWIEPFRVSEYSDCYVIVTRLLMDGGNYVFRIDNNTGFVEVGVMSM